MFLFVVLSFGGWSGPATSGMIFPIFINFPWQHCWVSRKRGSRPWIWVRFLPRECARLRLRACSFSWSSEGSWWARWKVELPRLKTLFNEILLIFYMEKKHDFCLSSLPAAADLRDTEEKECSQPWMLQDIIWVRHGDTQDLHLLGKHHQSLFQQHCFPWWASTQRSHKNILCCIFY